jgi:hypothetical protein
MSVIGGIVDIRGFWPATVCPLMTRSGRKARLFESACMPQTKFGILHDASERGLPPECWNEKARGVGIGTKRKADLYDLRGHPSEQGHYPTNAERMVNQALKQSQLACRLTK